MNKADILVVEDEALIAASLVHTLTSLGYTVQEPVSTGEDAIRAVKARQPDLVLMNIELIGPMNGIEAAEKIRAFADIPIVYLTAYTDNLKLKQAQLTNPYGYLAKPAHNRELNATIEMALYKHALDRKLQESEELFRSLFDSANDAIFLHDFLPDGKPGRYIKVNEIACERLGYTREELLTMSPFDIVSPGHRLIMPEIIRTIYMQGQGTFDTIHKRKDGTEFPVEINTRILESNGKEVALSIARDITERKTTESVFQALVRSMVGTTGFNSLKKITENIHSWLGAECVMIGEIQPDRQTVNVLSMFLDGKDVTGFSYTLKGTPCENVAEKGFCLYPDNAIELFPDSKDLVELNIRGYIGTPLRNYEGQVIGILCALFRKPVKATSSMQEIMDIIAVKAAAEIERKQAEETLVESEERFRMLLQHVPSIAIQGYNLDGITQYWNEAAEKLYGYTPEEALGKNLIDLIIPPELKDEVRKTMVDMEETGKPTPASELSLMRKDGSRVDVFSHHALVKNPKKGMELFCIDIDLTERKRAEEMIRESEDRFRTIINSMQIGIVIIDAQTHRILEANPKALEMIGSTTESVTGSVCHQFICPAESGKCPVTDLGQTIDSSERVLLTHKGERLSILKSVIKMMLGGREVMIESFTDISDRKRTEEMLRESEEKYRTLFDSAGDMIFIHDLNGRILAFNTLACERLGYTRQELMSFTVGDVDSPENAPHAPERIARLKEQVHISFETVHLRKDGSRIPVVVSAKLITWEGQPAVMSICHDISDRKRAEEALNLAGKKLALLSGITRHDINNQLTVLRGYLTILAKKQPDPALNEYIRKASSSAERISAMIQFTKEYEQLGVSGPVWQEIGKIAKMAAVDLLPDGVSLTVNTGSYEIYADPMFMMVIYNLFDNAKRHGVHVTEITVYFIKEEHSATLIVEDNGIGVPSPLKETIFEKGFGKNTGLGLFMIREILAITGLSIQETGTEGKGTRFEITLPPGTWREGPG